MASVSIKKRTKYKDIFCCDFETTSEKQYLAEGETRVYLWHCKNLKNVKRLGYGVNIQSFFEYLVKEQVDTAYFHNLSFDGSFILDYLVSLGYKNTFEDDVMDKEFRTIVTEQNQIYNIVTTYKNQRIEFKCSFKLLPLSIAHLGKLVRVKKLDETHNYDEFKNYQYLDMVPQEEIDYITNDVEIMRLALIQAFKWKITKLTLGASAFADWKRGAFYTYNECYKDVPLTEDMLNIVKRSYKGGIVQVNPKYQGKIVEKSCSYDNNSLYPSVMLDNISNNYFPGGMPQWFNTPEDSFRNGYKLGIVCLDVKKANIVDGYIPFIGFKTSFKFGSYTYHYQFSNERLYLWYEEYLRFILYYEGKWTVDSFLGFKAKKGVFNTYIKKWQKIKEENGSESPERLIAKLMLNNLYGKFGTNAIRLSKYVTGRDENGAIHYSTYENEGASYYKPLASYITSCARCCWCDNVQANKERFIYGDTDSIYLLGYEKPNLEIDNKIFGKWKFEHNYSKAKFLKSKCYIKVLEDGTVESGIAGLPKDAQKLLTFETLVDGYKLEKCKLQHKRVKGGVILTLTDFTIKLT